MYVQADVESCIVCGVPAGRWDNFPMSTIQTWDPRTYAKNARFVSELGSPVLELLSPRPGERILDLGCGDGVRTKKLADLGCEVVGVDSSAPQVEAARRLGLEAHVINGEELPYLEEFDAVFSNCASLGQECRRYDRRCLSLLALGWPLRRRMRRPWMCEQNPHRFGPSPQPPKC